jgi:hypothetical protein
MSYENLIASAQVGGVLVKVDDGICRLLGREYFRNQERAGSSDECATRDHGSFRREVSCVRGARVRGRSTW